MEPMLRAEKKWRITKVNKSDSYNGFRSDVKTADETELKR